MAAHQEFSWPPARRSHGGVAREWAQPRASGRGVRHDRNTLEAVIGASLLGLVPGFRPSLERVPDVIAVAGLAAGLSTAVSASVGVISLIVGGVVAPGAWWATWRVWWLGDALGALVVAPAILTWARPGRFPISTRARLRGVVILVGLAGILVHREDHHRLIEAGYGVWSVSCSVAA